MKNKILVGAVIVLSVLVLLMGGYIIYDNTNDKVLDNKNEVADKENGDKEQDNKVEIKAFVESAKKMRSEEGVREVYQFINIPMLIVNDKDVSNLNKKMEDDILKRLDKNTYSNAAYSLVLASSYDYLISGDLVSIIVDTQISPWNASGKGVDVYSYFYDLKNNKQISGYEALLMSGYTDSDIMNVAKECLTSMPDGMPTRGSCELEYVKSVLMQEQFNNGSSFSIENGKLKLNWYESAI